MGSAITSDKEKEFEQERMNTLMSIKNRFQVLERRNLLLLGAPQQGKTQLFRALANHKYQDEYHADETAKFAIKVFSTVKSQYKNLAPLSLHLVDAPGTLIRNQRAAEYYFKSPNVILICFDFSLLLDESKIDQLTKFTLRMIAKHHESSSGDGLKILPFVCHVFTKEDRAQQAVKQRNNQLVKNLVKNGVISNYLYVSARTGVGMNQLKEAIFDSDTRDEDEFVKPLLGKAQPFQADDISQGQVSEGSNSESEDIQEAATMAKLKLLKSEMPQKNQKKILDENENPADTSAAKDLRMKKIKTGDSIASPKSQKSQKSGQSHSSKNKNEMKNVKSNGNHLGQKISAMGKSSDQSSIMRSNTSKVGINVGEL